jgi:hypothetical protein
MPEENQAVVDIIKAADKNGRSHASQDECRPSVVPILGKAFRATVVELAIAALSRALHC